MEAFNALFYGLLSGMIIGFLFAPEHLGQIAGQVVIGYEQVVHPTTK